MEEQLAVVLHLRTIMFFIAAAILTCPYPSYVPYWLVGISVLMELVLAGKLRSTAALLAKQVGESLYGREHDSIIKTSVLGHTVARLQMTHSRGEQERSLAESSTETENNKRYPKVLVLGGCGGAFHGSSDNGP
jgi:hypothetical protein